MDYNCGVYFPKTGKGYVSFVDPADDTWIERHIQQSERTSGSSSDWAEFNTAANRRPLPQSMFSDGARALSSSSPYRNRRESPPIGVYSSAGQQGRPRQRSIPDSRDAHDKMFSNIPKSSSSGFRQVLNRTTNPSSDARRFSSTAMAPPANQKRFPPTMASSFPAPSGGRTRLPESLFSTLPDQAPARTKVSSKTGRGGGGNSARESTPTLDRASRRAILENVFLNQPLTSTAFLSPSPPSSPGKKAKLKIRFPTQRHTFSIGAKHQKQQQQQKQQQHMQHHPQQKQKFKKILTQKQQQGNAFSPKSASDLARVNKRPRHSLFAKVCFHCGTATKMAGSSAHIMTPPPLPGVAGNRDSQCSSNWSRQDLDTYGFDGIYGDIESQGKCIYLA
ncbi:hypothetical protein ElyMa_006067600 [Elysia marginata]|uniref:Uncharacterized protein n=1 Tax=Elysia marginata TaxID=1093978 RepID=A0AAV4GNJ6_9GAST|nr:hypothetical protein ElyMa_006067600 [Elysia marginata]